VPFPDDIVNGIPASLVPALPERMDRKRGMAKRIPALLHTLINQTF
jgi:hypothetical protein